MEGKANKACPFKAETECAVAVLSLSLGNNVDTSVISTGVKKSIISSNLPPEK